MIGARPVCIDCKHLYKKMGSLRCGAFPGGIPEEIAVGGNDHTKPFKGDHGIQFEHI